VSIFVASEVFRDRIDLTLGDLGDLIEADGEAIESATDTRLGVLAGDDGSMIGLGERSHRGETANSKESDDVRTRCIGGRMAQVEVGSVLRRERFEVFQDSGTTTNKRSRFRKTIDGNDTSKILDFESATSTCT